MSGFVQLFKLNLRSVNFGAFRAKNLITATIRSGCAVEIELIQFEAVDFAEQHLMCSMKLINKMKTPIRSGNCRDS